MEEKLPVPGVKIDVLERESSSQYNVLFSSDVLHHSEALIKGSSFLWNMSKEWQIQDWAQVDGNWRNMFWISCWFIHTQQFEWSEGWTDRVPVTKEYESLRKNCGVTLISVQFRPFHSGASLSRSCVCEPSKRSPYLVSRSTPLWTLQYFSEEYARSHQWEEWPKWRRLQSWRSEL